VFADDIVAVTPDIDSFDTADETEYPERLPYPLLGAWQTTSATAGPGTSCPGDGDQPHRVFGDAAGPLQPAALVPADRPDELTRPTPRDHLQDQALETAC
jgi:hypothetical protein